MRAVKYVRARFEALSEGLGDIGDGAAIGGRAEIGRTRGVAGATATEAEATEGRRVGGMFRLCAGTAESEGFGVASAIRWNVARADARLAGNEPGVRSMTTTALLEGLGGGTAVSGAAVGTGAALAF